MPLRTGPGTDEAPKHAPEKIDREKLRRAGMDVDDEILAAIPDDAPIPPDPHRSRVDLSVLPPPGKRKMALQIARIRKRHRYTEPEPNLGRHKPHARED